MEFGHFTFTWYTLSLYVLLQYALCVMTNHLKKAVCGTADYVLFTSQQLGRGAMGNVVVARHRVSLKCSGR